MRTGTSLTATRAIIIIIIIIIMIIIIIIIIIMIIIINNIVRIASVALSTPVYGREKSAVE